MDCLSFVFFLTILSAVTDHTEVTECKTKTVCRTNEYNGKICKSKSDCGTGECCYIKPTFEVVSRRRQAGILPLIPTHNDTGICEKYRVEHEQCGPLEQANGHCGCGSGMTCQFVPAEIVTAVLATLKPVEMVSKKRGIYVPGPGLFQCENTS